jgi:acetyl-CoA C-acetyltransferase
VPQGLSAEILAAEYKLTRKELDEFAYQSQMRAKKSRDEGRFAKSICAVPFKDETGAEKTLDFDDNIRAETTVEGLAGLKLAFKEDGVITAGNASAIVDGAGVLLFASEAKAKELKLTPRARVVATSQIGSPPKIMLTGPVEASKQALAKAKLSASQIDVWEINEAFAPIPVFTMRELNIPYEKVNVNGGGIALGHPLGATGAMLMGMAIDELERTKGRYALVTMCIGLGMGMATIIERV